MSPRRDLVLAFGALVVMLSLLPAFGRVFALSTWRPATAMAALLSIALAAAIRRLRGGAALAALASLVGLVCFVYVAFLPADGLVPGPEALRQANALLVEAMLQVQQEPAPAPPLTGLVLLTSVGFWIVAHVNHELLVRWSKPGLSLVPVVALWTVPLAIPQPEVTAWRTALPFLAAGGLLLLLGADSEAARERRAPRLSMSGVTVGAGALVLALLAPGVLPGYGADAWVDLSAPRDPRGYQPIVDVSERLQLPEERDVLRVDAPQRTYLRLAGLDAFDGNTWRLGPPGETSYQPDPAQLHDTRGPLPPELPAAETTPTVADVEVLALENIYVPAPYQPVQVLGPRRDEMVWSTEGGFLATWDTVEGELAGEPRVGVREGFTYRIEAERPTPTIDALRARQAQGADRERLTQLPAAYDDLRAEAQRVYADAGADTDVDRALALQDYFAGPASDFTYDLEVPPLRGDDALRDFVLQSRTGYCEYFATAMAVMLRATDVPARVAVGFLPGEVTAEADPEAGRELTEFTVSTGDAHAWVEVFFPEHGWITFEPTPRDDQTQIMPRPDDLTPTENERERQARELEGDDGDEEPEETEEQELPEEAPGPEEEPAAPPEDEGAGAAGPGDRPWPLAALAALLLAAAVALVAGRWRPGHLGSAPAARVLTAQRRLLEEARRYGLARRPAETTREVLGRWADEGRVDERAGRFAELAAAAAFGEEADEPLAREAERLAGDLEQQLRASVPTRDRLLAPVRVPLDAAGHAVRQAMVTTRGYLARS
jgi:transglutaminase-like putative cysteine protease